MRSIVANYVPNFPFPSELVASTLFRLIAMASHGEQMASNNDVCEKGTQLAPEAFICQREFLVVLQCGRATFRKGSSIPGAPR